jgi:hypothetical protein
MCSGGWLVADFVAGRCEQPCVPELADNLTMTADGAWVVWAYKLAREVGDRFVPLSGRGSYPADAEAQCLASMRGTWARRSLERQAASHKAPEPSCTCGFHALSAPIAESLAGSGLARSGVARSGVARSGLAGALLPGSRLAGPRLAGPRLAGLPFAAPQAGFGGSGMVCLTVALSGRVLAFEWASGGLLLRAARQTVVHVYREPGAAVEPGTAGLAWSGAKRPPDDPEGRLARAPVGPPAGTGPVHLALPQACPQVAVGDDAGWCQTSACLEPASSPPVPVLTCV